MTILLVEDTRRLADAIASGLAGQGFVVVQCGRGDEAMAHLRTATIDAAILDLGLPDCDGLDVLAEMRRIGCLAPVLVLTARDAVAARVAALEAGADDYVVKPFAFDELVARVRALIRRARAPRWAPLTCGDLELMPDHAHARTRVGSVRLSPRERALLEVLMRRQEEVVTRAELLKLVFGYDFDPGTNVIDVHVAHLRKKLQGSGARICTVRAVGFMLTTGSAGEST